MIKEIMLASAITLSQPSLPHFYDINNVYYEFILSLSGFDAGNYSQLIINLNNGTTEITNLEYNSEDGFYQKSANTTSWVDAGFKDFQNYLSWTYSNYVFSGFNIDNFSLEWDMSGFCYADSTDEEGVIECWFAIPGEDDSTLVRVSDYLEFRFSVEEHYAYIYAYDWVDALSFLQSDNAYLVLLPDSLTGDNNASVLFEHGYYYFNYSSVYMSDGNDYIYGSYEDFIYENIQEWVDYGEDLEYEYNVLMREASELVDSNQQLQYENAELQNLIQNLRQEIEELNSRHVFSNVFELVRGAFDGVVNFLEIELMPNLTIGTIIFIPVVIGVIFFILKALVL